MYSKVSTLLLCNFNAFQWVSHSPLHPFYVFSFRLSDQNILQAIFKDFLCTQWMNHTNIWNGTCDTLSASLATATGQCLSPKVKIAGFNRGIATDNFEADLLHWMSVFKARQNHQYRYIVHRVCLFLLNILSDWFNLRSWDPHHLH